MRTAIRPEGDSSRAQHMDFPFLCDKRHCVLHPCPLPAIAQLPNSGRCPENQTQELQRINAAVTAGQKAGV